MAVSYDVFDYGREDINNDYHRRVVQHPRWSLQAVPTPGRQFGPQEKSADWVQSLSECVAYLINWLG